MTPGFVSRFAWVFNRPMLEILFPQQKLKRNSHPVKRLRVVSVK